MNHKILIVQKDPKLSVVLINCLKDNPQYLIYAESSPLTALNKLDELMPDLVIIDTNEDELSFQSICQQIREKNISIRILTINDIENDISAVECIESGADDCLTKPLDLEELKARVAARIRYTEQLVNPVISCAEINLNNETFEVFVKDKKINLTVREFEILKLLLTNKNQIVSRDKILNSVWGYLYEVEPRAVDIQISKLRRKLSNKVNYIISVRGFGYKVVENATKQVRA